MELSIPGTLYEEYEYSQNSDLYQERVGEDAQDEEADELAWLPPYEARGAERRHLLQDPVGDGRLIP